jgi:hypothetical protein
VDFTLRLPVGRRDVTGDPTHGILIDFARQSLTPEQIRVGEIVTPGLGRVGGAPIFTLATNSRPSVKPLSMESQQYSNEGKVRFEKYEQNRTDWKFVP